MVYLVVSLYGSVIGDIYSFSDRGNLSRTNGIKQEVN